MKTIFRIVLCVLTVMSVMSCKQDYIKVDINIKGLGSQSVHLIYQGDFGAVDDVLAAKDGKIETECVSSQLTLVTVMASRGMMLARFAAQNGDHIKIEGTIDKPKEIKVSGNEATEQWMAFRNSHSALYEKSPSAALDKEIEKWVKEHPKQLSSTLLLLFDHSDLAGALLKEPLLNLIAPEARPEHLLSSVEWLSNYYSNKAVKKLTNLNLCGASGDFEQVALNGKPALLYFWSNDLENRNDIISAIKRKLESAGSDQLMVADVLVDPDTMQWKAKCRADSATWKHYWVPGGVMDAALRDLRIPSAPYFVATDSIGYIQYRGSSVAAAINSLP